MKATLLKPQAFDVIVIGGGAAGIMAAGTAATRGRRVLLIEKNRRLGEKLRITGGGRCNVTNAEEDQKVLLGMYGAAEQFLYSPFAQFGMHETFSFFDERGLPLVVQAKKRAFPETERADDVAEVLIAYAKNAGVTVQLNSPVREIAVSDGRIEYIATRQGTYRADSYVFATGGVSRPDTGSTGDGYAWLRDLGHTVQDPSPAIVPLRAKEPWIKALAGKTLPGAKVTFSVSGQSRHAATGDILLTHFGLSGPTILNSAVQVTDLLHEGAVTAAIDLFPKLAIGELDLMIRAHFEANKNKALKNVARAFLPTGTAETLLGLAPSVDPAKKVHSISREERRTLAQVFKALPVTVTGLMGNDRAVIADGGVPLAEMDMRTMRSRVCPNAFVVGDLLHIRRPSGGYSLQLCWTTGYVAGSNA